MVLNLFLKIFLVILAKNETKKVDFCEFFGRLR